MSNYKIIALFGPAGAGKDYIQKKIMDTELGKNYLHEIISCTTRPPREGEQEGVHYHFLSKPEELLKQDLLESTSFRGWWYGTPFSVLDENKINIGVFNLAGIKQLMTFQSAHHNIECLPVLIKASDKTRLLRQLNREANPDCEEIARRFLADKKDFEKLIETRFSYFIIKNETKEFLPISRELYYLIKSYKWSQ